MDPIVRAIDVGRGNTKYVVGEEGGEIRCAHFPSVAYPRETEEEHDGLSGRRRTIGIPIDGLLYEVGPDVHLAADVFSACQKTPVFPEMTLAQCRAGHGISAFQTLISVICSRL